MPGTCWSARRASLGSTSRGRSICRHPAHPRRAELDLWTRGGRASGCGAPADARHQHRGLNAVDAAENEPRRAFALNAEAVGTLGDACQALGAALVHFSTDYVFDGAKGVAYTEATCRIRSAPTACPSSGRAPGPRALRGGAGDSRLGLFGIAKSAGKGVRTSWRRCSGWPRGRPLRVVADQVLGPSYTLDVARAVWRVIGSDTRGSAT